MTDPCVCLGSVAVRRRPRGRELYGWAAPRPSSRIGNGRISQVPGKPAVPMPCSRTPVRSTHQAATVRRRGPRLGHGEGSHSTLTFGAQSHGLGTRCLRFVPPVARTGRKTRFPLLARLCGAGLDSRRVSAKGFCQDSYIGVPLSQAWPGANPISLRRRSPARRTALPAPPTWEATAVASRPPLILGTPPRRALRRPVPRLRWPNGR
jgi:hypothetical protein